MIWGMTIDGNFKKYEKNSKFFFENQSLFPQFQYLPPPCDHDHIQQLHVPLQVNLIWFHFLHDPLTWKSVLGKSCCAFS